MVRFFNQFSQKCLFKNTTSVTNSHTHTLSHFINVVILGSTLSAKKLLNIKTIQASVRKVERSKRMCALLPSWLQSLVGWLVLVWQSRGYSRPVDCCACHAILVMCSVYSFNVCIIDVVMVFWYYRIISLIFSLLRIFMRSLFSVVKAQLYLSENRNCSTKLDQIKKKPFQSETYT